MTLFYRCFVTALAGLVLSSGALAADKPRKSYSDKELVAILKAEGFAAADIFDERVIQIKVDGQAYYLNVYNDDDLQMYYGVTGYSIPVAAMNEWNRTRRLSRAYIDDEGDPVIESDLLANAGYTERQLVEFVKVFIDVVDVFRDYLRETDGVTET
ncbi:MAG: YbjN domain-containing protein [Pseudomonadota bacterium]